MQATVHDALIRYEIEGPTDAPVVTFSHSLATALELWDLQLEALRGSYRILRYDTRGHGRSLATAGPYTMEMLAKDVVGLLDHLKIEQTHFVGISMGGMIGQVLAVKHPSRLEKIVLCDTTGRVSPDTAPLWADRIRRAQDEGMGALAQETLERWLSEAFRRAKSETAEQIRSMILGTPVSGYVGCCEAIAGFDILGELHRVTAPTLILVGEKDATTPVSAAKDIQQQIRGSEVAVVPEALHLINVEKADLFNQLLLRFLG